MVDTPELHAAPTNTRTNAQIRFLLSIFNTLVTFSGLGVIILVRKRTEGSESLCPGGEAPPVTDPPPYTTLETQQGSYTSWTNLIVDVLPRNYSIKRSGYTELPNKQRNELTTLSFFCVPQTLLQTLSCTTHRQRRANWRTQVEVHETEAKQPDVARNQLILSRVSK